MLRTRIPSGMPRCFSQAEPLVSQQRTSMFLWSRVESQCSMFPTPYGPRVWAFYCHPLGGPRGNRLFTITTSTRLSPLQDFHMLSHLPSLTSVILSLYDSSGQSHSCIRVNWLWTGIACTPPFRTPVLRSSTLPIRKIPGGWEPTSCLQLVLSLRATSLSAIP